MNVVSLPLAELVKPERNVRLHTDRQLKELKRSVEQFGQIRPIVVDENNVMLAGNGLYEALASMGWTQADCYVVRGLTDKQKKKLMLADNKVYALGTDDMAAFDVILAELEGDCDIPGFDPQLLETLMSNLSDVDDMLSSYGTFGDNSRDSMQTAAERSEVSPRTAKSLPQRLPDSSATIPPQETINIRPSENRPADTAQATEARYIVCPRCGERIALGGDM